MTESTKNDGIYECKLCGFRLNLMSLLAHHLVEQHNTDTYTALALQGLIIQSGSKKQT